MGLSFFICYARENVSQKRQIVEVIKSISLRARIEVKSACDGDIPPGEDWDASIREMIDSADLCIILGSQALLNSTYIATVEEPLILRFKRRDNGILPILLTNVRGDDARELRKLQWIPEGGLLRNIEGSPGYDNDLVEIRNAILARVMLLSGKSPSSFIRPSPYPTLSDATDSLRLANEVIAVPAAEHPLLRITFEKAVRSGYEVSLVVRENDRLQSSSCGITFDRTESANDVAARIFKGNQAPAQIFRRILDRVKRLGTALRLQICLPKNGAWLSEIAWESIEINGDILGSSPHIMLSRSVSFADAAPADIRVKQKEEFSRLIIDIRGEPMEQGGEWLHPMQVARQPVGHHESSGEMLVWEPAGSTFNRVRLVRALRAAEVVYFSTPCRIDTERPGHFFVLPETRPDGTTVLVGRSSSEFAALLSSLGSDQPTVLILPPRAVDQAIQDGALVFELASRGVPVVIGVEGCPSEEAWTAILQCLLSDLAAYDYVDAAVLRARLLARRFECSIVVYTRVRSGRLWYRPGFTNLLGKPLDQAETLRRIRLAFSDADAAPVACIGGAFSDALSLSREAVARSIADVHCFSLSDRDRSDLAIVSEYVQMSTPREDTPGPPPHVASFIEMIRDRLLLDRSLFNENEADDLRMAPINRIVEAASRAFVQRSEFIGLARLGFRLYLTVYFHNLIELALEAAGRPCLSQLAFRRAGPHTVEPITTPTSKVPSVYHCFGDFREPEGILLSQTDYLDLLAEHVAANRPETKMVASVLASSSLFVMGFSPLSFELRLLLSIIKRYGGSSLSSRRIHVAVQIDPEDDHIIDNDRVKGYFRGMLSSLGPDVLIYWGTPASFLELMQSKLSEQSHC